MREGEHIDQDAMQALLREAYHDDPEKSLLGELTRDLLDPANPRDANKRPHAHPLWLILGLIAAFVASVFVFFSLFGS
jgi:hypothetical protein